MEQSRFLHPYYLLNGTLFLAYIGLRLQRLHAGPLSQSDMFGVTREAQIYISLLLILFTRALSAPTLDLYLASAFAFARVAVLLCLWHMHSQYAALFLALWSLLYACVTQPRYALPHRIVTLNEVTFGSRIANNRHRTIYVLWCFAAWSARCSQLAPVLARLERVYQHPRICFARLDVARWQGVAETLSVSVSAASKVLPCVICFQEGKEVARVPVVDGGGRVPTQFGRGFTAPQVAEALGLDAKLSLARQWEDEAKAKLKRQR